MTVTTTQTDTVIGMLAGGRKMVSTVVTANAGTGITPITVKPLTNVISYIPSIHTTLPADATSSGQIVYTTTTTSGANVIWITPSQAINGSIIEIISVGV